ncbi:SDR family NAD(P)-dependent oxidoreductase [Streptomyces ardesiacus]|uniref:SDR family NAD(P)-dependent oxidoreductase n=1 Tax=Streptomyces ardesiacus TaxID=285564 RepID=UPI0036A51484
MHRGTGRKAANGLVCARHWSQQWNWPAHRQDVRRRWRQRGGQLPHGASADKGFLPMACGVTSAEDVGRAFRQAREVRGPVEDLVDNATDSHLLLRMSRGSFTSVLNSNFAAFSVAKRAIGSMSLARIMFPSSVVGMRGERSQANYASLTDLPGLARSLARAAGGWRIANVRAPGLAAAGMSGALTEAWHERLVAGRQIAQPRRLSTSSISWSARDASAELCCTLTRAIPSY